MKTFDYNRTHTHTHIIIHIYVETKEHNKIQSMRCFLAADSHATRAPAQMRSAIYWCDFVLRLRLCGYRARRLLNVKGFCLFGCYRCCTPLLHMVQHKFFTWSSSSSASTTSERATTTTILF